MKAQVNGIFERYPSLDGLVVRFGETYLYDTSNHLDGKIVREGVDGIADHVKLLSSLRFLDNADFNLIDVSIKNEFINIWNRC